MFITALEIISIILIGGVAISIATNIGLSIAKKVKSFIDDNKKSK